MGGGREATPGGEEIGDWRRAELLRRRLSVHSVPQRKKPPPLPLLPLCLRGALRSHRFPKPQSLSRLILAQRVQGPASSALGPASPSVFPKENEGAQCLASLPCPPSLERDCLIKGEPAMYTSDKSNAQNKLIKTLCLQHILFLSPLFDLRCVL